LERHRLFSAKQRKASRAGVNAKRDQNARDDENFRVAVRTQRDEDKAGGHPVRSQAGIARLLMPRWRSHMVGDDELAVVETAWQATCRRSQVHGPHFPRLAARVRIPRCSRAAPTCTTFANFWAMRISRRRRGVSRARAAARTRARPHGSDARRASREGVQFRCKRR
jgi:hypothetical protein